MYTLLILFLSCVSIIGGESLPNEPAASGNSTVPPATEMSTATTEKEGIIEPIKEQVNATTKIIEPATEPVPTNATTSASTTSQPATEAMTTKKANVSITSDQPTTKVTTEKMTDATTQKEATTVEVTSGKPTAKVTTKPLTTEDSSTAKPPKWTDWEGDWKKQCCKGKDIKKYVQKRTCMNGPSEKCPVDEHKQTTTREINCPTCPINSGNRKSPITALFTSVTIGAITYSLMI